MPNEPVVVTPAAAVATPTPASPAVVAPAAVATPAAVAPAAVVPAAVVPDAAAEAAKAAKATLVADTRKAAEADFKKGLTDASAKQAAEWSNLAKTDKEFGGAFFDANLVTAKKVIESLAPPAFKQYLNDTGLGNHPEMIRLMLKIHKLVGEDKLIASGAGAGQGEVKSAAEVIYPNQVKKA